MTERKQLIYPNGMPVPVRDVWDVVDQLGLSLVQSHQHKKEAAENKWAGDFGLNHEKQLEVISHRDRLLQFLISNHGDKMIPQAKYTIVTKEMNEKQRYYRKGEYRLFMGTYSTLVVYMGITPDDLDIDPKKMITAYTVLDDTDFRQAKTPDERKDLLKKVVQKNKDRALEWI